MKHRLRSLRDAIGCCIDACRPVLREWKVRYFRKEPFPGQPGMVKSIWTRKVVWAYNREDAAEQVNPNLRPGYNCYVTKVMSGEPAEPDDDTD